MCSCLVTFEDWDGDVISGCQQTCMEIKQLTDTVVA